MMGLHLHTKQLHNEAEITVQGELTGLALAQLDAAIEHFRSRGCSVIHLNVEGVVQKSELLLAAEWAAFGSDDEIFAIR